MEAQSWDFDTGKASILVEALESTSASPVLVIAGVVKGSTSRKLHPAGLVQRRLFQAPAYHGRRRAAAKEVTQGHPSHKCKPTIPSIAYSIENAAIEELVSAQSQDFLDAIKHYIKVNSLLTWASVISFFLAMNPSLNTSAGGAVFPLLFMIVFTCKMVFKFRNKVKVQYEFDEYGGKEVVLIQNLISALQSNNALWQVNDVFHNQRTKTHAGASQSVSRFPIKVQVKKLAFLKTNAQCYFVKLKKEKLYILPDKMVVINGRKVGAFDLSDMDIVVSDKQFIENVAPKDAQILSYSWQYVNKNGTPDKRFNNNRQLPVCRYGTISFKTQQGFNTLIYCSNVERTVEFSQTLKAYLKEKALMGDDGKD